MKVYFQHLSIILEEGEGKNGMLWSFMKQIIVFRIETLYRNQSKPDEIMLTHLEPGNIICTDEVEG